MAGDSAAVPAQSILTVLVADDLRDSAETLSELLRGYGHTVVVAADGIEAVAQATRHRPDVAVLDIGMPGLDGYQVARKLRAEAWGNDMMLIALTGWGQHEDQQAALSAGYDFHITKPTDVGRLLELLAEAAASRRKAAFG